MTGAPSSSSRNSVWRGRASAGGPASGPFAAPVSGKGSGFGRAPGSSRVRPSGRVPPPAPKDSVKDDRASPVVVRVPQMNGRNEPLQGLKLAALPGAGERQGIAGFRMRGTVRGLAVQDPGQDVGRDVHALRPGLRANRQPLGRRAGHAALPVAPSLHLAPSLLQKEFRIEPGGRERRSSPIRCRWS